VADERGPLVTEGHQQVADASCVASSWACGVPHPVLGSASAARVVLAGALIACGSGPWVSGAPTIAL
jgi:hypothetical protein